jgi:hypothetical protein
MERTGWCSGSRIKSGKQHIKLEGATGEELRRERLSTAELADNPVGISARIAIGN